MEKSLILAFLLYTTCAFAMGDKKSWVGDWWENVYQQRIEKEQYQQVQQEADDKCEAKVRWYTDKLSENPKSEYYQYKLESWQRKCPIQ